MGIENLFGGASDLSDFSITTRLSFDAMVHAAKIEVNEEGATAAAATATKSKIALEHFICNHPFLFTIYNNRFEEILFTGIYRDPQ